MARLIKHVLKDCPRFEGESRKAALAHYKENYGDLPWPAEISPAARAVDDGDKVGADRGNEFD